MQQRTVGQTGQQVIHGLGFELSGLARHPLADKSGNRDSDQQCRGPQSQHQVAHVRIGLLGILHRRSGLLALQLKHEVDLFGDETLSWHGHVAYELEDFCRIVVEGGHLHDRLHFRSCFAGHVEDSGQNLAFFRTQRHALKACPCLGIARGLRIGALDLGILVEGIGDAGEGVHGDRALAQRTVHLRCEFDLDVVVLGDVLQMLVGFGHITQSDCTERNHQGEHHHKSSPDPGTYSKVL